MADLSITVKKVIEEAMKQGIPVEKIKGYLKLTKTAVGRDKEIMDALYRKNRIITWDLIAIKDIDALVDEVGGKEIMEPVAENEERVEQTRVVSEQESTENSNKSEKAKMLEEKVEALVQKIEQEKSPLKRHVFSFQVKRLIAKLQREIDLQNLKDEYKDKRQRLKEEKKQREDDAIDSIAELNAQIKKLERELDGNEEYDPDSPYFIYPDKYVKEHGGIEALSEKLKQSKKFETQQAAKRIEQMQKNRTKLNYLYNRLENVQEELEYSEKFYEQDKKDLNKEERSLIVKQKMSVFSLSSIRAFFGNMIEGAKSYMQERRQNKELSVKYNEEEQAIIDEYEAKKQALEAEMNQAFKKLSDKKEQEKQSQNAQRGQDKAAEFRDKMADMGRESTQDGQDQIQVTQEVIEVGREVVEPDEKSGEDR